MMLSSPFSGAVAPADEVRFGPVGILINPKACRILQAIKWEVHGLSPLTPMAPITSPVD